MEELQQYDIIELITTESVHIIGSFHSMVDGEIILFVPPLIQHILKADVTNVSRLKRKDEYDTSKIDAFFKHSSFIFKKRYKIHDILIVTFDDDSEIEAKITEIVNDCITLQLESQDLIYINFNYKSSIPNGILEIKRKLLHDLDDESEETNYTVVSYNIDESKCRYTLEIQLNAIVQYLNFTKQYDGELYAQRYKELLDLFPYGSSLELDQTKLKWIVPVTSANIQIAKNEAIKKSLTGTLMCYKKGLLINNTNVFSGVQSSLHSILRVFDKKYLHSQNIQTYLIPETVILKFVPTTASKELETNWVKKSQSMINYTTDETLPVTGYSLLPPTSIPFSKYYLNQTPLMNKIQLNLISHYHLFNINCEPSFHYQEEPYDNFIPTLEQLLRKPGYYSKHNPSSSFPTCYSIYEFIQALEPYHIYSNHISYEHRERIQNHVFKNIKTFLSKPPPIVNESTREISRDELYQKSYISSTELYAYALAQDSANAYVISLLTSEKIDPLKKPQESDEKEKSVGFVLNPSDPTCELKNDCEKDDIRQDKLNKFALATYHASNVVHKNKLDLSLLSKKIKYNTNQHLKYNNKFNELSSGYKSAERLSPTYEMFYQLMTFPLKKRYTSLLSFLTKYTTFDKETRVFICTTSIIPLVPYIFKVFAETYLTDIDEYNTKVYDYCRSSPEIYIEDGFYKDKLTGLSLAAIENVSSYDELVRSAQIELDETVPLEFTPDQCFIENHIQITWKEITYKPLLSRHTLSVFINDMLSQYNVTVKSTKISPNYLISLLIYVFIQFNTPCDKIVDEIVKNKNILTIDIGLNGNPKPFSFLSRIQNYTPMIAKLCPTLESKYTKQKFDITTLRKLKRKRDKKESDAVAGESTVDEADEDEQFMPYRDSTHPVLTSIKSAIQKNVPIHFDNGEMKRVNQTFIEPLAHKDFKPLYYNFHAFIAKHDFPPKPDIEFHFDIVDPVLIQPKTYPPLYDDYKTREPLEEINRQLAQLQIIIQDLTRNSVNEIIKKYPPLYFANYIKNVLQFYANVRPDMYRDLQDDVIPITHVHLIAPSHRNTLDRIVENYYKDFISNEKWGNLFRENRNILEELKQPLTESTKNILVYYLYFLCRNLPRDVTQFIDTKLKSELHIPDYAEIKKRMSVRQSVERQNFVHASKELSTIAKSLKMIIETEITKTSYNIAQFTSREEDALKSDNPTGDDGNE
jgi:hypothetical protein